MRLASRITGPKSFTNWTFHGFGPGAPESARTFATGAFDAIEEPAVAGGMELALWCGVRLKAESAYLGVYCRRWGITPMDGGTVRLLNNQDSL